MASAFLTLNGSICAAQPTLATAGENLQNKFLQAALAKNMEHAKSQALATIRVPTQETQYIWSAEGASWTPVVHYTYTYNNQGLWQTITERSLITNQETDRTIDIVYDAQGRQLESIHQAWNNAWVNETRSRNEYDAQSGQPKLSTEEEWRNNSWQLESGTRYTYTTGTGNRVEQTLTESYESGAWVNSSRTVNTFSGSGTNPVTSTTSEWDNGAWVVTDRTTDITYYENGQVKSYIEEVYDEEEEAWVKSQYTLTYSEDAAKNTSTITIVQADMVGENWVPASRTSIVTLTTGETYLGAQSFSELKSEFAIGNEWMLAFHLLAEITRDANGNITELIAKNYDLETEAYENLTRFVYSDFINLNTTSAENEVLASALQLYPNPTHDNLSIALDLSKVQGASLSIHNLTGQKVLELASLRGETVVDLGHLPSGVYMVRVTGTNKAGITRKIVKQ